MIRTYCWCFVSIYEQHLGSRWPLGLSLNIFNLQTQVFLLSLALILLKGSALYAFATRKTFTMPYRHNQLNRNSVMNTQHTIHFNIYRRNSHCFKCTQAAAVIWLWADVRTPKASLIIKILTVSVLPQLQVLFTVNLILMVPLCSYWIAVCFLPYMRKCLQWRQMVISCNLLWKDMNIYCNIAGFINETQVWLPNCKW